MKARTISESVRQSVSEYLETMDDQEVVDLYDMVLAQVEAPLIERVLEATQQNQSRAAKMLGLSRGTLRTKLRKYRLM